MDHNRTRRGLLRCGDVYLCVLRVSISNVVTTLERFSTVIYRERLPFFSRYDWEWRNLRVDEKGSLLMELLRL